MFYSGRTDHDGGNLPLDLVSLTWITTRIDTHVWYLSIIRFPAGIDLESTR